MSVTTTIEVPTLNPDQKFAFPFPHLCGQVEWQGTCWRRTFHRGSHRSLLGTNLGYRGMTFSMTDPDFSDRLWLRSFGSLFRSRTYRDWVESRCMLEAGHERR